MHAFVRASLRVIAAGVAALALVAHAQQPITLHGAVQFADDHASSFTAVASASENR